MAASTAMDEGLLSCGFCKKEFDGKSHIPKFLPCRHQTVCLQCIRKDSDKSGYIKCPHCQESYPIKDVSIFVDNSYIKYILKLKSKMESNASKISSNNTGPTWCLTCDSVAHSKCAREDHGLLNLTCSTIKNVERLVSLKNEFKSMKDRLALAIEKRKEIRSHFTELLQAVKRVQDDIMLQVEENDLQLADWTNLLEKNCLAEQPLPVTAAALDLDEYFLSELVTFVGHTRPNGTLETLKKKVEETALDYASKLKEITTIAKEIEEQRKMRICVRLSDPNRNENVVPIGDILCDGFVTDDLVKDVKLGPIEKASLLLLSHIVFTLHKQKINTTHVIDN